MASRARPTDSTSEERGALRRSLPVVIFDGDDTLWRTEQLYDDARKEASRLVAATGIDPSVWESRERAVDVENVKTFGLSRSRFPTSCVEAYEQLALEADRRPDPVVSRQIYATAASVFESRAPLVDSARSTLEILRPGHRLVLLTQGTREVQRKRIADSGLADLFDVQLIVDAKSVDVLNRILQELPADPETTWVVGNSLPSDVNPAVSAGIRAVWVDAHVWEHERREDLLGSGRVVRADDLEQVPVIVGVGSGGLQVKGDRD